MSICINLIEESLINGKICVRASTSFAEHCVQSGIIKILNCLTYMAVDI